MFASGVCLQVCFLLCAGVCAGLLFCLMLLQVCFGTCFVYVDGLFTSGSVVFPNVLAFAIWFAVLFWYLLIGFVCFVYFWFFA